MKEKFWDRFVEAWETWAPDVANLSDLAALLGANYDDFNNWKQGRGRPRKKVPQLAAIYEPFRARGCDPWTLARYVYSGSIDMPRPGGSTVPNVSAPTRPAPQTVLSILDPARSLLSSAVKAGTVSAEAAEEAITVLARAALSYAQASNDQLDGTASTRKFMQFGRVAA